MIRTLPGLASAACSAMAAIEVDGLVGTIAGDDTAFLAMKDNAAAQALSEETMDSLRSIADKQNVSLKLTGEHQQVRGIWQLLSEMVYNLCDNAIKYNRPGGSVTVDVSADADNVILKVSDTGIGIPAAHQKRGFERFYRVDKSHSKEIGGTGLGLSIVKHGAQFHQARVELESELGLGTTVTLLFPRMTDA